VPAGRTIGSSCHPGAGLASEGIHPDLATEIANAWSEAAGNDPNLGPAYTQLRRTIRQLIHGDVAAGGAAIVDGVPTMLVLAGTALFVAHATVSDDGRSATVNVKRLPVVADRIVVEVLDGLAGTWGGSSALLRHWKFTWADGACIEFDAVVHVYNGWHPGPDSADVLARSLATVIGWQHPSAEA
jgi:hypothetical protein